MLYVFFIARRKSRSMAVKPAFTGPSESCLGGQGHLGRDCSGEHQMSKKFSPQGRASLERALSKTEFISGGKSWLS